MENFKLNLFVCCLIVLLLGCKYNFIQKAERDFAYELPFEDSIPNNYSKDSFLFKSWKLNDSSFIMYAFKGKISVNSIVGLDTVIVDKNKLSVLRRGVKHPYFSSYFYSLGKKIQLLDPYEKSQSFHYSFGDYIFSPLKNISSKDKIHLYYKAVPVHQDDVNISTRTLIFNMTDIKIISFNKDKKQY